MPIPGKKMKLEAPSPTPAMQSVPMLNQATSSTAGDFNGLLQNMARENPNVVQAHRKPAVKTVRASGKTKTQYFSQTVTAKPVAPTGRPATQVKTEGVQMGVPITIQQQPQPQQGTTISFQQPQPQPQQGTTTTISLQELQLLLGSVQQPQIVQVQPKVEQAHTQVVQVSSYVTQPQAGTSTMDTDASSMNVLGTITSQLPLMVESQPSASPPKQNGDLLATLMADNNIMAPSEPMQASAGDLGQDAGQLSDQELMNQLMSLDPSIVQQINQYLPVDPSPGTSPLVSAANPMMSSAGVVPNLMPTDQTGGNVRPPTLHGVEVPPPVPRPDNNMVLAGKELPSIIFEGEEDMEMGI